MDNERRIILAPDYLKDFLEEIRGIEFADLNELRDIIRRKGVSRATVYNWVNRLLERDLLVNNEKDKLVLSPSYDPYDTPLYGDLFKCAHCQKSFRHRRLSDKYCSAFCRGAEARIRRKISRQCVDTSPSAIGTMAELEVARDLLGRGFPVYRALSPSAPYDLVVDIREDLYRVEVKTSESGIVGAGDRCDIIAWLKPKFGVAYKPTLDTLPPSKGR